MMDTTSTIETTQKPAIAKTPKSRRGIAIIVGAGLLLLGIVVMVIITISNQSTNQRKDLDQQVSPTVTNVVVNTTKPTITPTEKVKNPNQVYYVLDGNVYAKDLLTKQKTLLPIGKVLGGGESMQKGITNPLLSRNQDYLAYLTNTSTVAVFNLNTQKVTFPKLPSPTKGETQAYISGFNLDSSKLLIYLDCEVPMEAPDSFVPCPDSFVANNVGLYFYDVSKDATSKVIVKNNLLDNYNNLVGWTNYDKDAFIISSDTYSNNKLEMVKVVEVNTATNLANVIGNYSKATMIGIWDFDYNKNILLDKLNGTKWGLYINSKLIKEESGYTSMQSPSYFMYSTDRITYYSNTTNTADFKIIDNTGKLLGTKHFSFPEGGTSNFDVFERYLIVNSTKGSSTVYDIYDPANFKQVDTVDGNIHVITYK